MDKVKALFASFKKIQWILWTVFALFFIFVIFTSYKKVKKIQTPLFSLELSESLSEEEERKKREIEQKNEDIKIPKFHIEQFHLTPKYFDDMNSYLYLTGNFYGQIEPNQIQFIIDLGKSNIIQYGIIPESKCKFAESGKSLLEFKCVDIKLHEQIHIYVTITQPVFSSILIKNNGNFIKETYNDFLRKNKLEIYEEPNLFLYISFSFLFGIIIGMIVLKSIPNNKES